MTPQELYRAGELGQAIKALGEELRSFPLDAKRRNFLFGLLCFAGEYDRAEKHLDVLAAQDGKSVAWVMLDRSAIHAERTRQQMFRDRTILPHPADAGEDRAGEIDGRPFAYLGDADERIGDNIEVFLAGSYTWVPTRYIERLEIEPPATLRDLLWAKAQLEVSPEFRLQELGEVLLPVIAPLSYLAEDDLVKLGRVSVWEQDASGHDRLLGQKMLQVDGEEIPLLEIRSIAWTQSRDADGKLSNATA